MSTARTPAGNYGTGDRLKRASRRTSPEARRREGGLAVVPPPPPPGVGVVPVLAVDDDEIAPAAPEVLAVPPANEGPVSQAGGDSNAPAQSPIASSDPVAMESAQPARPEEITAPVPHSPEIAPAPALAPAPVPAAPVEAVPAPAPAPAPAMSVAVRSVSGEIVPTPVAAGFVGRFAEDGFRLPAPGPNGALNSKGELTKSVTIRVHPDLFAALHGMLLVEEDVAGFRPETQRVLDAALAYVPESLDDVEAFIAAMPDEYRSTGTMQLGNHVRVSAHQWVSSLKTRFKAVGRKPVRVEEAYRAALWYYLARYEERVGRGLLDMGQRSLLR